MAVSSPLNDTSGTNNGKVNVYSWSGSVWVSKGSTLNGANNEDQFGNHIQLNEDGNSLAIGARLHDANSVDSGQVKVYIWSNSSWVQRGNAINGMNSSDYLGHSVSLSADGKIVAIGSIYSDINASNDGAVYVYIWDEYEWTARGILLGGVTDTNDFGHSIHLSSDGDTLAVSGIKTLEYPTIQFNQVDTITGGSRFGYHISINSDGTVMAISEFFNQSKIGRAHV